MSGARRLWMLAGGLAALVVVLVVVILTSSGSSSSSSTSTNARARTRTEGVTSTTTTASTGRIVQIPPNSLSPYPAARVSPSPLYTLGDPPSSTLTGSPIRRSLPAISAPVTEVLGISVNGLFNGGDYTVSEINAQLRAVHGTGATVARTDALWEASEPNPPVNGVHHFVWSFDDTIATALANHRLTWLPILDYSAPWAQSVHGEDHSPPTRDAFYAAYAQAFAARYGLDGSFWRAHPRLPAHPVQTIEIWNEPDNIQFWTPRPNAAHYAGLYLAARQAIDAVDPSARVIVGGLIAARPFLPAMVRAVPQLRGHLDGVALHPYGKPAKILTTIRRARMALRSLGMAHVPLYVTEFGWTTSPRSATTYATVKRRPRYIRVTLSELGHLNCGVAGALLYAWVTPQHDRTDNADWYGIYKPKGGATSSTAAFTAGLALARRHGRTRAVC